MAISTLFRRPATPGRRLGGATSTTAVAVVASLVIPSLATPSPAGAVPAATELLYERTLMSQANLRCHLFTAPIAAALAASTGQARGAAERAGAPPLAIAGAEQRARAKADGLDCAARDLAVAAERVRTAFKDYAQLYTMTFPGRFADWRADRPHGPPAPGSGKPAPQWRLLQFAPQGVRPILFGVAVDANGAAALTVVDARPGIRSAAGARLILRDPARDTGPYLDPRRPDLASRLPPRARDQAILARSRSDAPKALRPPEARTGIMFQFPAEAVTALAALDPRDAVAVEFLYPESRGERVESAWFEVGDFAAAEAFLAAAGPRRAAVR